MVGMKSVRAGIAVGVIFLLSAPFAALGQEVTCLEEETCTSNGTVVGVEPENNFSAQQVADYRCAAGAGAENGFLPFRPDATCLVTPAPDASALECKGVDKPTVVSKCDGGKCVAKELCKKPLAEKPIEIPGGGGTTDPQQPSPTPTPSGPATTNPLPSNPTPSPTPSVPSGTGSGSSRGGGGSGNVPNGTPDTELPAVDVVQDTRPSSGSTFDTSKPAYTLMPPNTQGNGGTFGASPGNVFGDPFANANNTTFTGMFGGTGWGSEASAGLGLFANIASAVGNLFGGFGDIFSGDSSGVPGTVLNPAPVQNPAPTPRPAPVTTQPPMQPSDAAARERLDALDEKLRALNESRGIDINTGISSGRGPTPRTLFEDFPLAPLEPTDRIGLPTVGSGEPLIGGTPRGTLPSGVVNDAKNLDGITVPQPDPAPLPPRPTPTPPITRELATLEVERAREALADRWWLEEMLDWVGIGSDEGVAYQRAQQQLRVAAIREGLEKITEDVRSIPDPIQVAEGGPVITDLQSFNDALAARLTPQEKEQYQREWGAFMGRVDAAQTPEEVDRLVNEELAKKGPVVDLINEFSKKDPRFKEAVESDGGSFPVVLEQVKTSAPTGPYRLLEGLNAIGERVRDAAQRAIENVGRAFDRVSDNPPQVTLPDASLAQPLPEPTPPAPSTPTPAPQPTPQPAPQPTQTASRSSAFLQGGLGILSALLGTVINFFDDGDDTASPQPAPQPEPSDTQPAAASITANPADVDDGDTTLLSWTSVGTLSCVVVDSSLSVIRRGGVRGDLTSPALNASTRFGVICDIEEGKDKFINEVLVRVNGDDSEPERLFAQSGRASTAAPASDSSSSGGTSSGSTGSGANGGQTQSPQPVDVRTCDPQQSLESFTRCLCEAEPNPNGCSLVQ